MVMIELVVVDSYQGELSEGSIQNVVRTPSPGVEMGWVLDLPVCEHLLAYNSKVSTSLCYFDNAWFTSL